jgi:hypothetical protein
MTTAYTSLLGLALPVTGELSGTWGDTVNNSITSLLDSAVSGTTTISTDADITLSTTTGAANEAREAIILWTAGGTATRNITAPAQSKVYAVINKSSSTQSIVLRGVGPTTGVTIVQGEKAVCAWNGTDFVKVANTSGAGAFTSLDYTTTLTGGTGIVNFGSGQFYKDASGNVGMGTASPSTYQDSQGRVLVTGSSPNWATIQGRTDGPSGASNGASYGGSYSTNPINGARIFFGATGTSGQQGVILFYTKGLDNNSTQPLERMRIDNNGLVAVNTITPNASANVTVKQGTSGYQLQLEQSNSTDGYGLRCNSADGDLTFSRYASSAYREDMRLQNTSGRHNGRLLIGAVANRSGESKLEIVGPSSTPLSIYMLKTAQVEVNLGFGDGGDSNFYINSGSTTIGTSGVFLTNAGNSWNSVSDERMKTIVEPIENASAKLATLRTVIGYFNNDTK